MVKGVDAGKQGPIQQVSSIFVLERGVGALKGAVQDAAGKIG